MAYTLWTRHLQASIRPIPLVGSRPLHPQRGPRSALLYALLYLTGYDISLDDLKVVPPVRQQDAGPPEERSHARRRGDDRSAGPGRRQRRRHGDRRSALGRDLQRDAEDRRPHTYVIAGDGDLMEGVSGEAGFAGRTSRPRQAHRALRRQQDLAGRPDRRRVHRRRRRALRSLRLAHATRRPPHGQRRRRDRRGDRGREGDRRAPVADRGPHAHRLRLAAPDTFVRARRAARPGQRQGDQRRASAGRSSRTFYVPDDVLAWWRESGRRGAPRASALADARSRRGKRGDAELAAQFERVAGRHAARRAAVARVHRGERQRRDPRCRRQGDERHRRRAARTRRRLGRPRSVDENLPQGVRRLPDRDRTAAATSTSAYASTRWARSPTASRCTAACCRSRRPSSTSRTT